MAFNLILRRASGSLTRSVSSRSGSSIIGCGVEKHSVGGGGGHQFAAGPGRQPFDPFSRFSTHAKLLQSQIDCVKEPPNVQVQLPVGFAFQIKGNLIRGSRVSLYSTSANEDISAKIHNEDSGSVGDSILRPLSPHLPVYKPQRTSTVSIFNRISGAYLTGIVFVSYLLCLKMGSICFISPNFYPVFLYSSMLVPISASLAALAMTYHVFIGVPHLLHLFRSFLP